MSAAHMIKWFQLPELYQIQVSSLTILSLSCWSNLSLLPTHSHHFLIFKISSIHEVRITKWWMGSKPLAAANDNFGRSSSCFKAAWARRMEGKVFSRSWWMLLDEPIRTAMESQPIWSSQGGWNVHNMNNRYIRINLIDCTLRHPPQFPSCIALLTCALCSFTMPFQIRNKIHHHHHHHHSKSTNDCLCFVYFPATPSSPDTFPSCL